MNRNETKLLVESWRELLEGKRSMLDEGIDYLSEERLDEGVKENILMSIIALSSALPFNTAKASPSGDIAAAATEAFDDMDSKLDSRNSSELDKVKLYITILKEAGMSDKIGEKALRIYQDGDGETRAALVLYLRQKLNSIDRGVLDELDNNTGGEEYQKADDAVENSTETDSKGAYIVLPDGKKYRLKSSKTDMHRFIGDTDALAKQRAMRARYNSK